MSEAPVTLEGYYTLHDAYAIDWPRWNALGETEREAIATEAASVLAAQERAAEGPSACFSVVSQKADLCVVHWRRDIDGLRREQTALARTRLRGYLRPASSYLAVIELGTYELAGQAAATLARRGIAPEHDGFAAARQAEMERLARPRLFPELPARRYLCFYPMSKRRGETVNWYDLPAAERGAFMRGHGEIGRRYGGQVVQVIQGSVGLDDWEWGVTLFADDPLVFKKLIYEMRFDPASARFALFGQFLIGIRFAAAMLLEVLRTGVAPR